MTDLLLGQTVTASSSGSVGAGCETLTPDNPQYVNDGNSGTASGVCSSVTLGPGYEGYYNAFWTCDFGTPVNVNESGVAINGTTNGTFAVQYSTDNVTWVTAGTIGSWVESWSRHSTTWSPISARYWRLRWYFSAGGLAFQSGMPGLYTWDLQLATISPRSFVAGVIG